MIKVTFSLTLCLAFCSCNYFNTKKQASEMEKVNPYSFKNYVNAIHTLSLPFYDTCFDTVSVQRLKWPDSILRQHSGLHQTPQIIGVVTETENYTAILYSMPADVQLPILKTFNAKGEKISTLRLFIGKCCGDEEDCNGISCATITKDLKIILKDSTTTFVRNKKKYKKMKDVKITKRTETYKIDSDGKIVKAIQGLGK